MKEFSIGQLKALSQFFDTIAAAWFSGGIIAPFFARVSLVEKLSFFVTGFIFSYMFLNISLFFVREVEK